MGNKILELDAVSFSYGQHAVLEHCSASVQAKSTTAILGGNGQGKTTLMKCILRQNKAQSGGIFLYGEDISSYSVKEYAKQISYVPQLNSVFSDCVVRDYIVEGRTPYLQGFSLPEKHDYLVGEHYAEMLGVQRLLGKQLSRLSGGELQMVMIVRALVQETPVILMDEPLSALDMKNQVEVLRTIRGLEHEGKTILFTTHNPNHAMALNCAVWVLEHKTIAYSGLAGNIITEELLQEVYGPDIILRMGDHWACCCFTDLGPLSKG